MGIQQINHLERATILCWRNGTVANFPRVLLLLVLLAVAGCGSAEDRAQRYYERGVQYLSQKDYGRAGIEFRNALQLNKNLVGAWAGIAEIEERNGNWETVAGALRTVVELDASDLNSRLRLARLLALGHGLDEALNLVNAAGEGTDRHPGVLVTKAVILFRLNDVQGAVREARTALEVEPDNAEAIVVLAADRLARGDAEGALRMLDHGPVGLANDTGVHLFRLKIFEKLGQAEQVEAILRTLSKENVRFRQVLIRHYVDRKQFDDAERELRTWAAASSADSGAGRELISFLLAVKGREAARQEVVNRINAGVQVFQNQMVLADLEFALGNVSESMKLLENLMTSTRSREQTLAVQIKMAEIHLATKMFDAAEPVIARILKEDSRNTTGLRLRANLRIEQGQLDAAIADARQALNDQPRSVELMLILAAAYERSGSVDLADRQFADAMRVSSFEVSAGLNYVAFLRRRGNAERAEDILVELASRRPDNLSVLSTLADVKLERQNWLGAEEIAQKIRTIGNNRGLADQIAGMALSGRSRYEDSIQMFQSAHAEVPGSNQPIASLVQTLVRTQKFDRAIAFLDNVLKSNPDNAEAHVMLGSVRLSTNERDQALASFQTAIKRQPANQVGYRALADFYIREGKPDEALMIVRTGLQAATDGFALRLLRATLLEAKGDYEGAIAEYEYLLKQNSSSLIVINNLASLLSDHRSDKESLDRAYAIAAMLRRSPVPQFKDTLGWLHHRRGDHRTAVSLLEEAVNQLPTVASMRYHLGMSYLATGQSAKAADEFRAALELSPDNELRMKIQGALEKAAI